MFFSVAAPWEPPAHEDVKITAYHHDLGPCDQNKHTHADLWRILGLVHVRVFWGLTRPFLKAKVGRETAVNGNLAYVGKSKPDSGRGHFGTVLAVEFNMLSVNESPVSMA